MHSLSQPNSLRATLGCWEFLPPPSTNIDAAAAAAAAANTSTITTSPGGMPVAAICLKSIGTTILNVVASNRRGSGAAQEAVNSNTQKGCRHFSQLNPLIVAQKAANADTQKGLGHFSQLNPLVELRLWLACSTCQAEALASLLNLLSLDNACSTHQA